MQEPKEIIPILKVPNRHRFFRKKITVNPPIKNEITPPQYYHLDNMTDDGSIRIETNFKMRKE